MSLKNKRFRYVVQFFTIIIFFTICSRIVSGMSMAKVSTITIQSDVIKDTIEKSGRVIYSGKDTTKIPSSLYVTKTCFEIGDYVESGDILFEVDSQMLLNEIQRKSLIIDELRIDNNKTVLMDNADSKNVHLATLRLTNALEDKKHIEETYAILIKRASSDLEEANSKYISEKQKYRTLENEKDDSLDRHENSLITANDKVVNLEIEYNTIQNKYETLLELITNDNSASVTDKEANYKLFNDTLIVMKRIRELLDEAIIEYREIDDTYNNMLNNKSDLESYVQTIKESKIALSMAQRNLQDIQASASWETIMAARQLQECAIELNYLKEAQEYNLSAKEISQKANDVTSKKNDIVIKNTQIEIDELNMILNQGCSVLSRISGPIIQFDVEADKMTEANQCIVVADSQSGKIVNLKIDEQEALNLDNVQEIVALINNEAINCTISSIGTPDSENQVKLCISLPEGQFKYNSSVTIKIVKTSVLYEICIPIEAVHYDTEGTFVYLVEEVDSILGVENTVVRIAVTVIFQGDSAIALNGPLQATDKIIFKSNKIIRRGDVVRLI